MSALRKWRPRTQYNGFIFRISQGDLPASFGSWEDDIFDAGESITSLEVLETKFRLTIVWQIAEAAVGNRNWRRTGLWPIGASGHLDPDDAILRAGKRLIEDRPGLLHSYQSDPEVMKLVLQDYQIVLKGPIAPRRIIRIVSGSQTSGRQRIREARADDSNVLEATQRDLICP